MISGGLVWIPLKRNMVHTAWRAGDRLHHPGCRCRAPWQRTGSASGPRRSCRRELDVAYRPNPRMLVHQAPVVAGHARPSGARWLSCTAIVADAAAPPPSKASAIERRMPTAPSDIRDAPSPLAIVHRSGTTPSGRLPPAAPVRPSRHDLVGADAGAPPAGSRQVTDVARRAHDRLEQERGDGVSAFVHDHVFEVLQRLLERLRAGSACHGGRADDAPHAGLGCPAPGIAGGIDGLSRRTVI